MGKTLFDKVWERHVVQPAGDGTDILYIDLHFIHEVTSAQAFAALEEKGLRVFRPDRTVATADHNVPTQDQHLPIRELLSREQVAKLTENCTRHGIRLYGLGHPYQGIVHVIGPELGLTQPGMTIVCGDSHTATHGAFGSIAFGIGTSEVAMVLAAQCLPQVRPRLMRIRILGTLQPGVVAKDVVLHIISVLSAGGATGYFIEYAGPVVESMSMEGRMTLCNMSIEMGARGGMIAPDETTVSYLKQRPFAPAGADLEVREAYWRGLFSDPDAEFDREVTIDGSVIAPMITYGTNPGMGVGISHRIPEIEEIAEDQRADFLKSLSYMGFSPGERLAGRPVDYVFIGSCTNARIEDLRLAAQLIRGRRKAEGVEVWIVPGSSQVARQAREEGLDRIFEDAGIPIRQPGCSACLAMNEDKIPEGRYCLSTSNRNFEGRQGNGARTLLASPLTAAAAAVTGRITDARALLPETVMI